MWQPYLSRNPSAGCFSCQCVYGLWSNMWGRKCKLLPSIICQKWFQIYHTIQEDAWIVQKRALGWAPDPRKNGDPREGWTPCSLEILTMSTYEETAWWCTTGTGSQLCIADKKHHELQSAAIFRGQEIRDFIIRRHTVDPLPAKFFRLARRLSRKSYFCCGLSSHRLEFGRSGMLTLVTCCSLDRVSTTITFHYD